VLGPGAGLGRVSLTDLGTVASALAVADVPSPAYAPPQARPRTVRGESFSGPVARLTRSAGTALEATIDWGDGTRSGGTVRGTTVSGSHTFAQPGTHTVTVRLADRYGGAP
jgi:hypothetical protein